ncbi:MAG TPA: NUDIX hydrolase [Candidatus Bathyarchaeia archaeon]|nr:NUDIX hydrolase [Candidatus Bathyarchaeia archaeon]
MWKTISSKIVFKNPWWQIRKDRFETHTKKKGDFYFIDIKESAFIIPVKGNKILFEKQYRYPIKKWTIELPGGSVKEGLSSWKAAEEELREELGYKAGKLERLGKFVPYNGVSSEICSVFLATDLKFIGADKEETEYIDPVEIGVKQAYRMVEENKIIDGMTITSLMLAQNKLLNKK